MPVPGYVSNQHTTPWQDRLRKAFLVSDYRHILEQTHLENNNPMSLDVLLPKLAMAFDHHAAKNVVFRHMARCDAFPLFVATRNPAFNNFLLWPSPSEEAGTLVQVEKLIRERTLKKMVVVSICERNTGTWFGYMVFKPFRDGLEMSLYLHPASWNRGVVFASGCSAIELMMRHCPGYPIYNRVHVDNERMKRICLGYGFEKIDQAQDTHATGSPLTVDVYQLNQARWKPYAEMVAY